MIVKHRPQDAGTATEYTMALDRSEFVMIQELVRLKAYELEPISTTESMIIGFYALLRVMLNDMKRASVEPIPLPETLRHISMFPPSEDPPSLSTPTKRTRKRKSNADHILFKEPDQ